MFARVGDPQQWGLILSKILAVWSLNTHNRTRSRRPFVRHHAVALSFFQNRDLHRRSSDVMFIPRGWNLFFSGTGTADFHPEVLEKARPISPLAEIRQNNAGKNCGKDLNSTPWFAPFYCLFVRGQSRDY